MDQSDEFWPEPGVGMVLCIVLGTFDVSMIFFLVRAVAFR